ncbi:MAG: LysE family translocator [Campylobacteraceae bacterium]|nr:LysE family translocator [Campylobacteraceae bacterium]
MIETYTFTLIVSIFLFSIATSMTPGPNNIMLLSSGLTYGYKRTIPHALGVVIGFPLMTIFVGLGLGEFFKLYPITFTVLKSIGILYLLWLAWKISRSTPKFKENNTESQPLKFIPIVLFQWINPKNWIKIITAMSVYVTSVEHATTQIMIITLIFFLTVFISANSWALGGVILKKLIKSDVGIKRFNVIMAILLVLSLVPTIFE